MSDLACCCPWNSPGKNSRVGCHSLHQGILPTQGLNPGLPQCRQILYHLSHQGKPMYSMGLYKGITACIHCHSVIQSSFTPHQNPLCSACSFFSLPSISGNCFFFFFFFFTVWKGFAFSRMSYSWDSTYVAFSDWLHSPSYMHSRCLHIFSNLDSSL